MTAPTRGSGGKPNPTLPLCPGERQSVRGVDAADRPERRAHACEADAKRLLIPPIYKLKPRDREPRQKGTDMSNSTESKLFIPAIGRYRIWAVPTDQRHHISILINGRDAGVGTDSQVGPFSDAKVETDMDLSEGDEVTTMPANAHLAVRRFPDFEEVYDSDE